MLMSLSASRRAGRTPFKTPAIILFSVSIVKVGVGTKVIRKVHIKTPSALTKPKAITVSKRPLVSEHVGVTCLRRVEEKTLHILRNKDGHGPALFEVGVVSRDIQFVPLSQKVTDDCDICTVLFTKLCIKVFGKGVLNFILESECRTYHLMRKYTFAANPSVMFLRIVTPINSP